jgi:lycopene beta-cyclase
VIDARGADKTVGLALGWQKFVGRTFRYAGAHRCSRPVIMDATVDQSDGYRFVYALPFSDSDLMLEDTYYSTSPLLDTASLGAKLDAIAGSFDDGEPRCLDEEAGVLPVVIGGDLDDLWPRQGTRIARLGLRGGFFHPTTGYSLPDAARNALLLASQPRFDSAALHAVYHGKAAALWKERRFFQLLNRMLFHAAAPDQRYRVLQHFYRLPEAVIARFYAARLSQLDKLRILSGRPPVPIGRAIAAMRRKAA